jgi:hypothetical protein
VIKEGDKKRNKKRGKWEIRKKKGKTKKRENDDGKKGKEENEKTRICGRDHPSVATV